tara:strand:+ start:2376 stop:2666 length:291 start_codon:yes stop_codon:yes gene_type:complete
MTGYEFPLTCAHCGGALRHQADGTVTKRAAAALGECTECRAMWRVDVRLSCVREPVVAGGKRRVWSLEDHPQDMTAPFAGLIRLLMQAEDELAVKA